MVLDAVELSFGELRVPVARLEELRALKLLAWRPGSADAGDARALVACAGEAFDLEAVRSHLAPFGAEVVARLEALLGSR